MNNDSYFDINGEEIKVGDTVKDWCTGKPDKYILVEIKSAEELEQLYVRSWGLLEVV